MTIKRNMLTSLIVTDTLLTVLNSYSCRTFYDSHSYDCGPGRWRQQQQQQQQQQLSTLNKVNFNAEATLVSAMFLKLHHVWCQSCKPRAKSLDSYNPLSFRRSAPARASASLHRHKPIDPKSELAHGKGRDNAASSVDRGRVSMPRVRSLEHRTLQEWSLFNSPPPDARQNSPPGYSREHKRGKSRKGR
ncbi:hypothetical protein F2P81_011633 [Scophthalmus maximus]|uniref:Uncharacterized protein n=1 Tax=Scophthalmus maximus TaxID=52904 RepID=A0A6A4SZB9_SCOMX|nr:hypothetical protein F2P81_011633 [Scophthalmus maximus]